MKNFAETVSTAIIVIAIVVVLSILVNAIHNLQTKKITSDNRPLGLVRLVEEGRTFCSGAVISDTLIVTAAHCVSISFGPIGDMVKRTPTEIRLNDNESLDIFAKVKLVDPTMDHAILQGDFKTLKPFKIITNPLQLDAILHDESYFISCGYPFGGSQHCSRMTYLGREGFMAALDGLVLPGMSGGPLVTKEGVLLGTNVAVEGEHSIVSPIYNLINLVEK